MFLTSTRCRRLRWNSPTASTASAARVAGSRSGVIGSHLLDVGARPLRIRGLEIGPQVIECRCDRIDPARETILHQLGRSRRSASVVVPKHEGDVVPILGLAPRKRRRGLGDQEPGQARDVHLGATVDALDPGAQFAHLDVAGCEAGAAEVQGSQILARVERDHRLRRFVAEVGQQLELHDRRGGVPACGPAPGPAPLGDEPGVAKRPVRGAPRSPPRTRSPDRPARPHRSSRRAGMRFPRKAVPEPALRARRIPAVPRSGGRCATAPLPPSPAPPAYGAAAQRSRTTSREMLGGLLAAHARGAQVRVHAGPRSDAQGASGLGKPPGRHRGKRAQGEASDFDGLQACAGRPRLRFRRSSPCRHRPRRS